MKMIIPQHSTPKQLFVLLHEWETDLGDGTKILAASNDKEILRRRMKESVLEEQQKQDAAVNLKHPYVWNVICDIETGDSIQLTHEPYGFSGSVQNWYWDIIPAPLYQSKKYPIQIKDLFHWRLRK